MPCYDPGPTADEIERAYQKRSRHDSAPAELLCAVMKRVAAGGYDNDSLPSLTGAVPGLVEWWAEHRTRDALKLQREERNKANDIKRAEQRLMEAESALRALKKPVELG